MNGWSTLSAPSIHFFFRLLLVAGSGDTPRRPKHRVGSVSRKIPTSEVLHTYMYLFVYIRIFHRPRWRQHKHRVETEHPRQHKKTQAPPVSHNHLLCRRTQTQAKYVVTDICMCDICVPIWLQHKRTQAELC